MAERIRLWYLLCTDLKEDQSATEWVFPEVFSMADNRSKSTEGRSKPGVGWRPRNEWYCMQSRGNPVICVGVLRDSQQSSKKALKE